MVSYNITARQFTLQEKKGFHFWFLKKIHLRSVTEVDRDLSALRLRDPSRQVVQLVSVRHRQNSVSWGQGVPFGESAKYM